MMDLTSASFAGSFNKTSTFVNLINVKVRITTDTLFDTLVKEYEKEVMRVGRHLGSTLNVDLQRYMKTLLWMHVHNVNGTLPNDFRMHVQRVEVPTVFATFMAQIGRVTDRDFGITFIPEIVLDAKELMSVSELIEVSNELTSIHRLGLHLVQGLPNPRDCGSLGSMGASLVESGDILSYRHDHPVFGFVSALFRFNATEELFGMTALRIRYGTLTEYENMIHGIFSVIRS